MSDEINLKENEKIIKKVEDGKDINIVLDRSQQVREMENEIIKLKTELELAKQSKPPVGGDTAQLNEYQTGNQDEKSVYGSDLNVEFWEFNSEQEFKQALSDAVKGKFGAERQKEAEQIFNQIHNQTQKIADFKKLEFELDNTPMTPWKFNGVGKPASFIPKDKRQKPKMQVVKRSDN